MAFLKIGRKWVLMAVLVVIVVMILVLSVRHENVKSILDSSFAHKFVSFNYDDEMECEIEKETKINWKTINVTSMTPEQIIEYFLWTNQTSCKLSHDFGGKMLQNPSGFDGQKAVCLDLEVAPKAGHCIVYSFGINYEWSFDEAMESYGCQVCFI